MNKVMIIGATGIFGQRLAQHLAQESFAQLILTSRSLEKALALAETLSNTGSEGLIEGIALDHETGLADVLKTHSPDIVVDCSGPFQMSDYRVAETALQYGCHFIDLADASDYLRHYQDHLDPIAKAQHVCAFGGASSTPALSFSVVKALTKNWKRIDDIKIAICPAGQSLVGPSVLKAVLSYAGKPVSVWQQGRLQSVIGWASQTRVQLPKIGGRLVAPVETYDAEALGVRYQIANQVRFYAGLESTIEQWGMFALAKLVQLGIMKRLDFMVPLLVKARHVTRIFTSHRGGMLVEVMGIAADGSYQNARWSLVAEQDEGLHVPTLAAAALVRKLVNGKALAKTKGAMIADQALALSDIEAELAPYAITTEIEISSLDQSIYQRKLRDTVFGRMPAQLQLLHSAGGAPVWKGRADVSGSQNPVVWLIRKIVGFPDPGQDVPLTFSLTREQKGGNSSEHWTREFGTQRFHSTLSYRDMGFDDGAFHEQFGPLTFEIGLKADDEQLEMPIIGWRIGPIKLPAFLAPTSVTREFQDERGRFHFDAKIDVPFFGTLVHYQGWLEPEDS